MNVDVVYVLVMVMVIGERGKDGGRVVEDVAVVEECDGGGGHVVVDDGERERR